MEPSLTITRYRAHRTRDEVVVLESCCCVCVAPRLYVLLLIILGQAMGATPCGGALAAEGARKAELVRAIFRDNSVEVSRQCRSIRAAHVCRLCRSIRAAHVSDIVILLALGLCLGGEL